MDIEHRVKLNIYHIGKKYATNEMRNPLQNEYCSLWFDQHLVNFWEKREDEMERYEKAPLSYSTF